MRFTQIFVAVTLVCWCARVEGQVVSADALLGEQVLKDQGCIACHLSNGQSRTGASDLGRRRLHKYTPSDLAASMWNHVVGAWTELGTAGAGLSSEKVQAQDFRFEQKPELTETDAAAMFAYFASRRYFEPLGDAKRGKRLFAGKGCSACHGISDSPHPDATPVAQWQMLGDPVALVQTMWNGPLGMAKAHASRKADLPKFNSRELTDLVLYLENLPTTRGHKSRLLLAGPGSGRDLVQVRGCTQCHTGKLALENRKDWLGATDIAAVMWNHPLKAAGDSSSPDYEEAGGFVNYLWSLRKSGDPGRGSRTFAKKNCTTCHTGTRRAQNGESAVSGNQRAFPVTMMRALFNHGPSMQAEMKKKGMEWPRLTEGDMADVEAFLNATPEALEFVP